MPETRRDLFRTSVVAALGVTAGAVAGCGSSGGGGSIPRTMTADSVAVVRAKNNIDKKLYLYFFHFEKVDSSCSVYSLPAASAASIPSITKGFDTVTVFKAALPGLTQVKTYTPITFVQCNNTSCTLNIDVDINNHLKQVPLSALLKQIYTSPATGSWYEIGKQ